MNFNGYAMSRSEMILLKTENKLTLQLNYFSVVMIYYDCWNGC